MERYCSLWIGVNLAAAGFAMAAATSSLTGASANMTATFIVFNDIVNLNPNASKETRQELYDHARGEMSGVVRETRTAYWVACGVAVVNAAAAAAARRHLRRARPALPAG